MPRALIYVVGGSCFFTNSLTKEFSLYFRLRILGPRTFSCGPMFSSVVDLKKCNTLTIQPWCSTCARNNRAITDECVGYKFQVIVILTRYPI